MISSTTSQGTLQELMTEGFKLVRENPSKYSTLHEEVRNNEQFAIVALRVNFLVYQYLPPSLKELPKIKAT